MCRGKGRGRGFWCPEDTLFNQRTLVCDFTSRVKCNQSKDFFYKNEIVHLASITNKNLGQNKDFEDNFRSGNVNHVRGPSTTKKPAIRISTTTTVTTMAPTTMTTTAATITTTINEVTEFSKR